MNILELILTAYGVYWIGYSILRISAWLIISRHCPSNDIFAKIGCNSVRGNHKPKHNA